MTEPSDNNKRESHTLVEDVLALLLGALVISFGVDLIKQAGGLCGGFTGLAFLAHYTTGVSFGAAFFTFNLPFYWLAFRRMGLAFLIKTFSAILMVSVFTDLHPQFISIAHLNPYYAVMLANALMGLGFLVLFRHQASLGGLTVVALYMQDRHHIRAGRVMMVADGMIMLASLSLVRLPLFFASILGALILNLIIAMNHRPGRYHARGHCHARTTG
jgi:uncharacterized membrane-anchored protein YitT (DUF2179 family)